MGPFLFEGDEPAQNFLAELLLRMMRKVRGRCMDALRIILLYFDSFEAEFKNHLDHKGLQVVLFSFYDLWTTRLCCCKSLEQALLP